MDEKSKDAWRIFVLADTHNRLPDAVREIAKDADEIWHLGDVCAEAILDELRAIGPRVTVVRGNCDSNFEWPLVLDLSRGGLKFRLQHVPPGDPPDDVDVLLHRAHARRTPNRHSQTGQPARKPAIAWQTPKVPQQSPAAKAKPSSREKCYFRASSGGLQWVQVFNSMAAWPPLSTR